MVEENRNDALKNGSSTRLLSRDKILEAALAVFSQNGFHQAKMDDIAKLAGVAKGTLYYNFSSKAKLFAAMATEGMETIIAEVKRELESDLPFIEHFRTLIESNVYLYLKYSELARVLFRELSMGIEPEILQQIEKVRERYVNFIADMVREGQEKGYLKSVDPQLTAVEILGMLENICDYYRRFPGRITQRQLSDNLFSIMSTGLLANRG